MSPETTATTPAAPAAAAKPKRAIEILRERHGGMSKGLKEYFNEQQKTYKALRAALKNGPRTVPHLARECSLPAPTVMWHLMAMRRYGEVLDGPEQDGYLLYTLKGA
jgi:predicted transcriptional regulator